MQGARDRWGSLPEPSVNNYEMWLEWWACQLDTPNWWEELTTIPNAGDPKQLAQKICASFKIPGVRCETIGNHKEYTAPPAPKCIKQGMFLPNDLPYQDVWLKSPWRTLAYAQALQYWAEKTNPPVPGEPHLLVMNVCQLRWHMRRYTTFHDCNVFEGLVHGLPEAEVEETTQPDPIEPSVADSPTVLAIVVCVLENVSGTLIATPATSKEESVTCVTISTTMADEPADPPTPLKTTSDVRSPTESEYLRWVKVHSSCMAASVGSIPCNPGDRWQCHCNCSSSWWKRAWHLLEEEWWALRGISSSASSGSSLELAAWEGDDPKAKPKVLPLGFQEIARSLTADEPPKMEIDHPQSGAAQELPVESTVATVCLYGTYELGGPLSVSWPPRANHRGTDWGGFGRRPPLINSSVTTFCYFRTMSLL